MANEHKDTKELNDKRQTTIKTNDHKDSKDNNDNLRNIQGVKKDAKIP